VDRRPARFSRRGQELTVVPRSPLPRGQPFAVAVAYAGHPKPVIDPDGSLDGWIPTPDGAFVASEPQGAPSWFPANDNPRDKASFDFAITVPRGITAIANGRLVSVRTSAGRTTWRWREDLPMATYLATATNGVFDLRVSHFGRVPLYQAADPAEVAKGALDQLAAEAGVLRFFAGIYGRYPFSSGGGVVDHAPNVGYFLESQTRVQYAGTPDLDSLVHELAHQWFGDAVSLQLWRDIWLNEGFATFSQWYYDERHGGPSAQAAFDQVYAIPADDPFWSTAPAGLPGPEELFSGPVYARGAATLQALRTKVGDRVFFAILRAWYQRYRYGNATTRQFIALAERISGRSLERFFDVWLYEPAKPSRW
jgi:aminopeptidase N